MHFRETLDLVGVEPQFTKRSEYKLPRKPSPIRARQKRSGR